MFPTNDELVGRAKKRLRPALAAYVESTIADRFGKNGCELTKKYFHDKREFDRPPAQWDSWQLLRFMMVTWNDVSWDRVDYPTLNQLIRIRNVWAHEEDFTDDEANRAGALIDRLHEAISPPPGPKLLKVFNRQVKLERKDPSWHELLPRLWPDEWRGIYYPAPDEAVNLRGVQFCSSIENRPLGTEEGVSLYVLPPDRTYRKTTRSPAVILAAELLSVMTYPNSAVFLSLDDGTFPGLKEAIFQFRAWEEVARKVSPDEQDRMQACLDESYRAVLNHLREGYRWLLIPTRPSPDQSVEWKVIPLEKAPNPHGRAGIELERTGELVTRIDPTRLAKELTRVPMWQSGQDIRIADLCLEFSRHLHLPRLRNWGVLDQAIAESLMNKEWEAFGYAAVRSDSRQYHGMYFRGKGDPPAAGLLNHRVGLLIKPQVARAQVRKR